MKRIFILSLFLVECLASQAAEVVGSHESLDDLFNKPSAAATNPVLREFECIRSKVDASHAMIRQPQAWAMIKKFSGRLEDSFNKLGFTGIERAFFYSQALAETGGFAKLTESKDYLGRVDPIGQLASNAVEEKQFKARDGAKKSAEFGAFRGRGLVQISRCDNLISVIHYMNQMERGRSPVWKADWTYMVAGKKVPITSVCNEDQIKAFESDYRMRFGMDADAYGVLRDPMRISMTDAVWKDKVTQKSIASEQLMVNASMAYWRGRCGPVVGNILTPTRLESFEPCQKFTGGSYLEHAIKCMTYCVRGTTEGWQERLKWMEQAVACTEGGVLKEKAAFQ